MCNNTTKIAENWYDCVCGRAHAICKLPCIPSGGKGYEITFRSATAEFHITVENPDGVCRGVRSVTVDGREQPDLLIPLAGVTGKHEVRVVLGSS